MNERPHDRLPRSLGTMLARHVCLARQAQSQSPHTRCVANGQRPRRIGRRNGPAAGLDEIRRTDQELTRPCRLPCGERSVLENRLMKRGAAEDDEVAAAADEGADLRPRVDRKRAAVRKDNRAVRRQVAEIADEVSGKPGQRLVQSRLRDDRRVSRRKAG